MSSKREVWVDYVKVFACILVVLGHFFQSMVKANILPENGLYAWFNTTIYYFHVPLFFICSGYLYQKYSIVDGLSSWKQNTIKKAVVLGIPYFAFSLATWLLKTVFSGSVNNEMGGLLDTLFIHPTAPYWYLYVLFFIFVLIPTVRGEKGVYALLVIALGIGADDPEIGEKIKELYASFCQGEIVVTDIKTAEMTKVVENTFRAVNIAFANELAKICRHDNMDVYEVIKICNMHPRVNILQPGPGVGGHCISVDPWFLVGDYPSLAKVIDESMRTNDSMPDFVLNRIYEIMKEKGMTDISRVGLYGLTYKENVDDMRESPTLQLLESQERHLATGLKVYDPFIKEDVVSNQYHDLDEFLGNVDLVVLMVKHNEIKENMAKLNGKVILDCHNICNLLGTYKI